MRHLNEELEIWTIEYQFDEFNFFQDYRNILILLQLMTGQILFRNATTFRRENLRSKLWYFILNLFNYLLNTLIRSAEIIAK